MSTQADEAPTLGELERGLGCSLLVAARLPEFPLSGTERTDGGGSLGNISWKPHPNVIGTKLTLAPVLRQRRSIHPFDFGAGAQADSAERTQPHSQHFIEPPSPLTSSCLLACARRQL